MYQINKWYQNNKKWFLIVVGILATLFIVLKTMPKVADSKVTRHEGYTENAAKSKAKTERSKVKDRDDILDEEKGKGKADGLKSETLTKQAEEISLGIVTGLRLMMQSTSDNPRINLRDEERGGSYYTSIFEKYTLDRMQGREYDNYTFMPTVLDKVNWTQTANRNYYASANGPSSSDTKPVVVEAKVKIGDLYNFTKTSFKQVKTENAGEIKYELIGTMSAGKRSEQQKWTFTYSLPKLNIVNISVE